VKAFLQRLLAMLTAFTLRWPSWLTELLSGLVTVALAVLLFWAWARVPYLAAILLGATGLSFGYEKWLDPNGWSMRDVAQREIGIVAGILVMALLRAWFL
jgi:hypothetical protein